MSKHGGDIYTVAEKKGDVKIYDFSANINPFGISDNVRSTIINSIDNLINYPDPENRQLIYAISEYHNISRDYIVCGNGGADIIFRTVRALKPENAFLIAPTFSEYGDALNELNCSITLWKMPYPFEITGDIIYEIKRKKYDIIFLCSPNNPTGTLIENDLLFKIFDTAKDMGTFVFLDECFFDMTGYDSEINSMISHCSEYKNLFILKSMTKMYAIAGLRLGYGICSDTEIIKKICSSGQPWAVNTIASQAGITALKDYEYRKNFLDFIMHERQFMYIELQKLGFEVWKPNANYIFFKAEKFENLDERLLDYNIMIRHCDNYIGLNNQYYRICVRSRNENIYLLDCIRKIIGQEELNCRLNQL